MFTTKRILFLMGACAVLCAGILYFKREDFGGHLYKSCHWITVHRNITFEENKYRLRFRAQKCTDPYLKVAYKLDNQKLLEIPIGHPDKLIATTPRIVVSFWPYNAKNFKNKIAEINADSIRPDEKSQCVVVYNKKNNSYSYQPKSAYMTRMLAKNEPFEACGQYGYNNDKTAYFRIIDKRALVFFDIGQESPLYVPQSFHLDKR